MLPTGGKMREKSYHITPLRAIFLAVEKQITTENHEENGRLQRVLTLNGMFVPYNTPEHPGVYVKEKDERLQKAEDVGKLKKQYFLKATGKMLI